MDDKISVSVWDTVYERMESEFNTMCDQLLTSAPQEIIDNAYQIVIMQDILLVMENNDLSESQLGILSELEHPLDTLYQDWIRKDYSHMEQLRICVADYSDSILKQQVELKYSIPASPLYTLNSNQAEQKLPQNTKTRNVMER